MDREECERSSQGKKVADGRCGMAIETKSSFGHTQSIEVCAGAPRFNREGTRLMARSSSAIPDGDRGDGTALSRWLPSARPAVSVDPSPTPHPHNVNGKRADRRRSHNGSCIGRVFSDKPATEVSPHLPGGRSRRKDGSASKPTGSRRAYIDHTDPPSRGGARSACLPTALARSERPTSAARRRCNAPLDVARRNVLRPVRRACRPGNLPELPALSPGTSRRGWPRQGTVSMSVCLNSSAVASMGTL